jgi:hypothetical protein
MLLNSDLVLHPTGVYSFEEWKKGGVPREIRREEEIFALIGVDWHRESYCGSFFVSTTLQLLEREGKPS